MAFGPSLRLSRVYSHSFFFSVAHTSSDNCAERLWLAVVENHSLAPFLDSITLIRVFFHFTFRKIQGFSSPPFTNWLLLSLRNLRKAFYLVVVLRSNLIIYSYGITVHITALYTKVWLSKFTQAINCIGIGDQIFK